MTVRVLVTGARTCSSEQAGYVREVILGILLRYKNSIVVHGQSPGGGVDLVAHRLAVQFPDATPEPHQASWDLFGKAAGPIRNKEMVQLGATICLAFPTAVSHGTWDCIRQAVAAGIETRIYPIGGIR